MHDLTPLANFYIEQKECNRGCLLAVRDLILKQDSDITEVWKYKMPFFCYKGKMFCYLWTSKSTEQPYLGIVEGKHFDEPLLIQEGRSRMKILLIDPNNDLPVQLIDNILQKAINLYKTGIIKINK